MYRRERRAEAEPWARRTEPRARPRHLTAGQFTGANLGNPVLAEFSDIALARTRLRYASFVDRRVTADKARVLRVPGSLHGGSGLVCCKVPSLDHLKDMSWILDLQKELLGDEEVEVSISKVANTYYGVFEPGEYKVSKHIAYAMLCNQ